MTQLSPTGRMSRILFYIRAAALAWRLGGLAAAGKLDDVKPVLDIVELTFASEPDEYLRTLLVEGLIEDLQNACPQSDGRVRLVDVRAVLGPRSTAAWDTMMEFWHGPRQGRRCPLVPRSGLLSPDPGRAISSTGEASAGAAGVAAGPPYQRRAGPVHPLELGP